MCFSLLQLHAENNAKDNADESKQDRYTNSQYECDMLMRNHFVSIFELECGTFFNILKITNDEGFVFNKTIK